jgi:hypothetical protein
MQIDQRSQALPNDLSLEQVQRLFAEAERAFTQGRHSEAAGLYERMLAAGLAPGLMLFRLGMIANSRGERDLAWRYHNRAVQEDPNLPSRVVPEGMAHRDLVLRREYQQEDVPVCPVCEAPSSRP